MMIIKEYTIKDFKQKHNKIYNEYLKPLAPEVDLNDNNYIIRTLENRGDIVTLEMGYESDNWSLV